MLAPLLLSLALATPAEVAVVGAGGISSMRADGSARALLVPGDDVFDPAWSPDGARLAYVNGDRIEIDGAPVTAPPDGGQDHSPVWSPDGGTLLYARFVEESDERLRTEIRSRVLATGAETAVVTQPLDARFTSVAEPAFAPGGGIAYARFRLNRTHYFDADVFTVPAAGGAPKLLLRDAQAFAFSPDGTRIAYSGIRDHNGSYCGSDECSWAGELYVADANGRGARRLTRDKGETGHPAWAPDGSRIAFASDRNLPDGDSTEVYSVAPDGSCLTWLTNGAPATGSPAWRPGSGDSFGPGSCDPATRPVRYEVEPPAGEGLWLGLRYKSLLLSNTRFGASYDDCVRFTRCPEPISLSRAGACNSGNWAGLMRGSRRFTRERGALVSGERDGPRRVLSGRTITTVSDGAVLDDLRPYSAQKPGRLAAPRVPRTIARRLDRTAALAARVGAAAAARQLNIEPFEVVTRERLRAALRPYRFC